MFEIGQILDGKVTGLTNFGAFISLPDNKTGMVHISEVSASYVNDIHDFLKEGQEVKVKIIDISDAGKISLSIKKVDEENNQNVASEKSQRSQRPRNSSPNVWKGTPEQKKNDEPMSFEDMMAQFKQKSDEKLADLKRANDSRRSSYSRRK